MAKKLRIDIIDTLIKNLGLQPSTIRVMISKIKQKHTGLTSNAAAHILAQQKGKSILAKLDNEDKTSMKGIQVQIHIPAPVRSSQSKKIARKSSKLLVIFFEYPDSNHFVHKHIIEINNAYNTGCYTACYILSRKLIENLIIEHIYKKKFAKRSSYLQYYWDNNQKRYKDFAVILENLKIVRKEFDGIIHKAIDQLIAKGKHFKSEANDKTHSLYHIATKKELDESEVDTILALIEEISKSI